MSRTFRESLPSEWVKYLVVALLSIALWIWAFGLYHAPKATEKIELFFVGDVKNYSFEKDAAEAFDYLKKVEVSSANPNMGVAFEQKYSVVGMTASDVMLVPESIAVNTDCKRAFDVLQVTVGESFIQEGVAYGVYLSEGAMQRLSNYFRFVDGERYVAFAPASSVNAGGATDHSFRFIEWLVR